MTDAAADPRTERDAVDIVGSLRDYPLPFAAFYDAQFRRAVSLAWVLTGSRETAEELVQDVMADAHRRWRTVGAYDQPAQWLRRAVLNRSVSVRRRAMARARGTLRLAGQPHPDGELDVRDDQLWATVRRLPNRQGQLVALVYVEGLTIADAADVLGIAVPTAKTHLARARTRLAHDLAAWQEPGEARVAGAVAPAPRNAHPTTPLEENS